MFRPPTHLDNAHGETNNSSLAGSPAAFASPRGTPAGPSSLNPSAPTTARGTATSSLRAVSPAMSPVWQAGNPFNSQEQQQRQPRESDSDSVAAAGGAGLGSGAPSLTSSISLSHHNISSGIQGQQGMPVGVEPSLAGGGVAGLGAQHPPSSSGPAGVSSSAGSSSGGQGCIGLNPGQRPLVQQRSDPVCQGVTASGASRAQSTPGGVYGQQQQQQEQVSQRTQSMTAAYERQHGAGGGGGVKSRGESPRLGAVGEGVQEGVAGAAVLKRRAGDDDGEARHTGWFSGRSSDG